MIGSQAMFEQQIKLNLLMICFVITEEPILTNTKRKNIIQTMKILLFTQKKNFRWTAYRRKKKTLFTVISEFFFTVGARSFHLPVVTTNDYSKTLD